MGYYEYDGGKSSYDTFDWHAFVRDYANENDGVKPSEDEIKAARGQHEEREREQQGRFRAIAAIYEKADRIITLDPVSVKLVDEANGVSAWSDGRDIYLNTKLLRNYDDRDIVSLHGVNYHEVCHIMYSPRAGSDLGKWVLNHQFIQAFNVLEDQRIETLFSNRFPSTRVFLEAEVLRYVIGLSDATQVHLLIHGRRFVSRELRLEAYRLFAAKYGKQVAQSIADIIDEYRTLALPRDVPRAKELIERMQLIMLRHDIIPPTPCVNRTPAKKGRPEAASEQARDAEKDSGDSVKADEIGDPTNKGGEDSNDSAGTPKQVSEQEKRDAADAAKELSDIANEMLDDLINTSEARRETREFRNAVRMNEFVTNRIKKQSYDTAPVDARARTAASKFGDVLRQIEEEADPTWEYETPSGKLNTNRAMHFDINDFNTLFDRWYEGDDATVIEAAILLDRSGSMAYRMDAATEAMWAIKRGLEKIDSRVTVYTFNEASRLLYGADEKAEPSSYRTAAAGGNTNPLRALEETELIMEASTRPTKIVFMVTDGYWDYEDKSNEVVARMNAAGVLTVVVFIGDLRGLDARDDEWAKNELARISHGARIMRSIAKPEDFVPLAERVVTAHLNDKIRR